MAEPESKSKRGKTNARFEQNFFGELYLDHARGIEGKDRSTPAEKQGRGRLRNKRKKNEDY